MGHRTWGDSGRYEMRLYVTLTHLDSLIGSTAVIQKIHTHTLPTKTVEEENKYEQARVSMM